MPAALKRPRVAVRAAVEVADTLLERRRPAVTRRLAPRERRTETAAAAVLVAVAVVMALLGPGEHDLTTAALLTACYALMRGVRFQLGPGLIRPTQLVFVPMLFLTPPAAVPLLVAIGALLGEVPEVLRGRAHPERLLVTVADGWYAVGPALVLATLAGGDGVDAAWSVLVLALLAQVAVDFIASTVREGLGAGISPAELAPVLALVSVIDALLAPIGFLAVLASEAHPYAYLLAITPGALLGLIARERSSRIAHELALERAFRRSTRGLDARADDLRRQAGRVQAGDAGHPAEERGALERVVLATTMEALQAHSGRLSELDEAGDPHPRLTVGDAVDALGAAEAALGLQRDGALAVAVGRSHVLTVARGPSPFSAVERDLLEHLAAQAAVSLENLRLEGLTRRTSAELRAILESVGDAVAAEDAEGRLVYVNAAASRLLDGSRELGTRLGLPADLLPGRRMLRGLDAEPLIVRHPGQTRWSRVKASPVLEDGDARLAISVVEDITEIKQAEEAQRFLAESARLLARSLDVEETLPEVARLVAGSLTEDCAIHLLEGGELRLRGASRGLVVLPPGLAEVCERGLPRLWVDPGPSAALAVPILVRDGCAGTITLHSPSFSEADIALAEDLGLRIGAAVDNARLYRSRAEIAQTLQGSLLPPELPDVPGVEVAARYRPAGDGVDVGGDFYDVFSTREGEWFAVIGDVCGRGAAAAAVTAMVRYTLRAMVMADRSPAGILRRLNAAMLRQGADRFVTLAMVRLDLEPDGTVLATVSNGGHPLARILRADDTVEVLGATGTLLGVLADVTLEDRHASLAPGDALILYTDGLTDGAAPRVWSPTRLESVIAGARGRPAEGIAEHLLQRAGAETQGPPRDDLALLALRVQPLL